MKWDDIDEVWASVKQTGTSENFEFDAARKVALRNATIRIEWRDDVDEAARVIFDNLPWDIKGIAEVGHRRQLELFCQTDVHRATI